MKKYQKMITDFNKSIIKLNEKYSTPTFFEIIHKGRDENVYSSFLQWMFEKIMPLDNDANPIFLLLDVLVDKDEEKSKKTIDSELKTAITTRKIKITSIEAETEKMVADLSREANKLENLKINNVKKEFEKRCKDRIDLLIRCKIDGLKDINELQIIIENKIEALQRKKKNELGIKEIKDCYDKVLQTTRYYNGTKRIDSDIYQIYVYLTSKEHKCDYDEHYIHINYQDFFDGVIDPLMSSSLSNRFKFLLEEFSNQLAYPSLNDNTNHSLAIRKEQSNMFADIWEKHKNLITASILSLNQPEVWEYDNKLFSKSKYPKKELAEKIVAHPNYTDEYDKDDLVKDKRLISKYAKKYEIAEPVKVKNPDNEDRDLLISFLDNNKKILIEILSSLKSDKDKKEFLLLELSKIDRTKYTLIFNNEIISDNLGKRPTLMKAFEKMIENNDLPPVDTPAGKGNIMFYYKKEEFEKAYNSNKITYSTYNNLYNKIGDYYVFKIWEINKNWKDAIKILKDKGFVIKTKK